MKENITIGESQQFADFLKKIDWSNPYDENRKALATAIVESINQDMYAQDLSGMLADVRTFGPGEEIQFKTQEGLVAYVIEPGSYAPRSQVTNTVTTLPKKLITVATELELGQLRSGRYGSIADLKTKAVEQILGAKNYMLWEVARAAVTSTTTAGNYATVASSATAATKKAALDAAITYLEDYTNTGAKAIVGRFTALSFLEDLDSTTLPDELRKLIYAGSGYLGNYKGVPVIRLKSFKDLYGNQKISASDILVLGEGTLKMGIQEPGLEVFEQIKGTTTHMWEMAFWYTVGACAVETHKMYRIAIS